MFPFYWWGVSSHYTGVDLFLFGLQTVVRMQGICVKVDSFVTGDSKNEQKDRLSLMARFIHCTTNNPRIKAKHAMQNEICDLTLLRPVLHYMGRFLLSLPPEGFILPHCLIIHSDYLVSQKGPVCFTFSRAQAPSSSGTNHLPWGITSVDYLVMNHDQENKLLYAWQSKQNLNKSFYKS